MASGRGLSGKTASASLQEGLAFRVCNACSRVISRVSRIASGCLLRSAAVRLVASIFEVLGLRNSVSSGETGISRAMGCADTNTDAAIMGRSEEHTSELQ